MNGTIIAFLIIFGYFIPSIMALSNKKKNKSSIIVVNIFLGWTFIGWVVALSWAISKDNDAQIVTHKHDHDIADKLEKLASLKEKGVITEEEFAEQKKKILGK
jgi:hypothetical protein